MLLINYTVYTGNGNIASSAYHGVKICDAAGTAVVSYCSSNAADYPDATAGYMLTLPLNVRNLAVGKYRIVPFYRTAAKGDDLSYWVGDVYDDQFIIEKKDDGYIYKATSMTTGMEAIAATDDWSLTSTASTLLLSGVPEGAIAKVYTPNGMLTATATIAASPTAIDMTAAQPGMYVVSVVAADGATKTFKAILRK
jgi:hypothetical protein